MSIHMPETNGSKTGEASAPARLKTGAGISKSANAGMVIGFWAQTPTQFENGTAQMLMARYGGATGGSDGYVKFTSDTALMIEARLRNASNDILPATQVEAPGLGKRFLFLLIVTQAYVHLCTCVPGAAAASVKVQSIANTAFYAASLTFLFNRLGSGDATTFVATAGAGIDFEEWFAIQGLFPETSGVPDTALIAAIASGSQDLDTLMGGTGRRMRYRMRDRSDLADAWGLMADLVPENVAAPAAGAILFSRGRLRPPSTIRPNAVSHLAGQLEFATTGDLATATTSLDIEGGMVVDANVRSIEARLIKEDGTDHLTWWTVAAVAAGATTWPATVKAGIGASTGLLELEFRAKDASGVVLGTPVRSNGLRATCVVCMSDAHGQSQMMVNWETHTNGTSGFGTGAIGVPSGMRVICQRQKDTRTYEHIITSGDPMSRGPSRGFRQIAHESNLLFPGVPVFLSTCGEVGTSPDQHASAGALYGARTSLLRAHRGLPISKGIILMFGHSSLSDITMAQAKQYLADTIALAEGNIGTALRVLIAPVSGMPYTQTVGGDVMDSQDAFLDYAHENGPKAMIAGDWYWVQADNNSADPREQTGGHAERCDTGMGQFGAMIAYAFMAACNAIPDRPRKLTAAKATGSTVKLTYGLAS